MLEAYLQHGLGTKGPFSTEQVEIRRTEKTPANYSRTGYGSRLPTDYMIKWHSREYRVYYICYSNCGTFYIKSKGERIIVSIYN